MEQKKYDWFLLVKYLIRVTQESMEILEINIVVFIPLPCS